MFSEVRDSEEGFRLNTEARAALVWSIEIPFSGATCFYFLLKHHMTTKEIKLF
jgi:hypothetical protein